MRNLTGTQALLSDKQKSAPIYSVIVPIYNEQDCIITLYNDLYREMSSISASFEIIFIDDGSVDYSRQILKGISRVAKNLIIVCIKKHSGKSKAMQTGFSFSRGKIIITTDADLQFDPRDIRLLLDKKKEGFDVICGWRHKRSDPWIKSKASVIANYLRRLTFHEKIHDVGCPLRVYSRDSFASLNLYGERHRFITAILNKKGFKIGEIKIRHYCRNTGKSKYGIISRLFKSIPDFFNILIYG